MIAALQKISKYYTQPSSSERLEVLKEITFSLEHNDKIAIIGPSGSGKSTFLNILGTLDIPTSGTVFIDERDVNSLPADELAAIRNRFIGFVFQQHYLLPQLTLWENILLPTIPIKEKMLKKESQCHARRLLQQTGLEKFMNRLPAQLSLGECQRAAVIRALVNKPRLLLADEPTGSLDRQNALNLTQLLLELSKEQQTALMVVTHSAEVAGEMDIIYKLNAGTLQRMN